MSSEDTEEELPKLHAHFMTPLNTAALVLLIPVLILYAVNQREIRTRNAKITKWLMIGVLASNGINQSLFVLKFLVCVQCKAMEASWWCSKGLAKGFNWLFLIHRAKLVQGMNAILSTRWFEKIFPAIAVVIICGFIFSLVKGVISENYVCAEFEDWAEGQFCVAPLEEHDPDRARGTAAAALGLDLFVTTFLMFLFIVPLYKVYNVDLGQMNVRQKRERKKLRDLLIWSVMLTFMNQATSSFWVIWFIYKSDFTTLLWLIGFFDPAINVWTAWLMITNNRRYLRKLCCVCSRLSAEIEYIRQLSGLTNVSRTSAILTSAETSQAQIDITSVQMCVSKGDLVSQIPSTGSKSGS